MKIKLASKGYSNYDDMGENGQIPLSKKKKKIQHFAQFPKLIREIEFQKNDISLISLGKRAKCWIVFLKRAKANFFLMTCLWYLQRCGESNWIRLDSLPLTLS